MNYKKNLQNVSKIIKNKKVFYFGLALILLIVIVSIILVNRAENNRRLERERNAQLEKQKAADTIVQEKKSILNRSTFFLGASAGARGGMDISNYWEGSYRIVDTLGKKMTIVYIKDSEHETPLAYVRYDDKANFKLGEGEVELKTNSAGNSYAYYFYPVNSYQGINKDDFRAIQKDFEQSFKTFSIF